MKKLLSTTALMLVLGFPALGLAQTTTAAADQTRAMPAEAMPGFLAKRDLADVYASELIGHDVHARRLPTAADGADSTARLNTDAAQNRGTRNADGTYSSATMNRADLDNMDNIGQVNEIILSRDGKVRALVVGVGGFLGMGERDVAVTMDQVTFASDANDRGEMYIIMNSGSGLLRDSPAYDRTSMNSNGAVSNPANRTASASWAAPAIKRDGYSRVEAKDVSTDMLTGKTVYDIDDNDVGTVTDLMISDSGAITNVIIDFGGFLGMGESQVSMDFDELTIMTTEGNSDVRVYVDATKEQIQGRPQYQARN